MLISSDQLDAALELVGGKGQGLLGLKSLEARLNTLTLRATVEVPDFFIIPPEVELDSATAEILARAEQIGSVYAVRSSSALEDVGEHSFDGIFDSVLDVRREGLIAAVEQVRRSATAEKAQQYSVEVGVALDGKMPVIVQRMIQQRTETGVAYSKFPCSYDITQVIIDEHGQPRMFSAFPRNATHKEKVYVLTGNPLIVQGAVEQNVVFPYTRSCYYSKFHKALAECAVFAENELGDPRILEFAFFIPGYGSYVKQDTVYLFQARKCTKFPTQVIFLHESDKKHPGFLREGSTNGVGDYTGIAYFIKQGERGHPSPKDTQELVEFDENHPEGYVLITPYLEFCDYRQVWGNSPHKKAVVAYCTYGMHHDLELMRKAGMLYVNVNSISFGTSRRSEIQTGDTVRVVSDGLQAFVFNLSRTRN